MNQITENVACNSDYYNPILDENIQRNRFHKIMNLISSSINNSIDRKVLMPLTGRIVPPSIDIDNIVKYFNISFFNKPFTIFSVNKSKKCNSFVFAFVIRSIHDVVINSKDFLNESGANMEYIQYEGWPVQIRKRIQNSPVTGKDRIIIVYTQDIFHFTFHSTRPKLENGICIPEEWENKKKGAFHLKLDCINRKSITDNETPLSVIPNNKQPYFPFIYDISSNKFMTMGNIIGYPENDLYTTIKTNTNSNMCHDEYTEDLWYIHKNKRPFNFTDNSGNRQNYIHKVINPIYNYIVAQLNRSMALSHDNERQLHVPTLFGKHPYPTPISCSRIMSINNVIKCNSDPVYNKALNNARLNDINKRDKNGGRKIKSHRKQKNRRRITVSKRKSVCSGIR